MLQQHPTPRRLLLGRVVKEPAVEEVLVNGCQYESAAGEQFTQVRVPGIGEIRHVVVPMNDQHQGKWPGTFGVPDPGIERQLIDIKAPVLLSRPSLPAVEILEEERGIHGTSFDSDRRPIFWAAR